MQNKVASAESPVDPIQRQILLRRIMYIIYVGIDVAKDKHDYCTLGSEADKLYPVFTLPNNKAGFDGLYKKIFSATDDKTKIKVGLEATGHYHSICPSISFCINSIKSTFLLSDLALLSNLFLFVRFFASILQAEKILLSSFSFFIPLGFY